METPIDIIMKHLGPEGTTGLTAHQLGMNIDLELQDKFLHFNILEEIASAHIEMVAPGIISAGSGPEAVNAGEKENPAWILNRAINTLALYWEIAQNQKDQEELVERRPKPGIYQGRGIVHFIVIVTEDRKILVQQDNGGLNDRTLQWDTAASGGDQPWNLQRINITDGTIEP